MEISGIEQSSKNMLYFDLNLILDVKYVQHGAQFEGVCACVPLSAQKVLAVKTKTDVFWRKKTLL